MTMAHLVLWAASWFWIGVRTSEVYVDVLTYLVAMEGSLLGWLILVRDAGMHPWRSWKKAIAVFAIISAPLFFSLPMNSVDVMYYQAHGRLWTAHGVSPYTHSILDYAAQDPWVRTWTPSAFNPLTPYGPLHTFVEIIVSHLSGSSLWLSIFIYKGMMTAALAGILFLLWWTFRIPSFLVVGVGLSPFVLMESVNNAHHDIVLVLLLMLFLVAVRKGDLLRGALLLVLAILWKIPAMLLAPFFVWTLIQHRRELNLPMTALLGIGLGSMVVIAAIPFLLTGGLWDGLIVQSNALFATFASPLPSFLVAMSRMGNDVSDLLTKPMIRTIGMGFFLLSYLIIGIQWMRSKISWPVASAAVFGSYLLFASFVLFPWYALWLVFFLPLLPFPGVAISLLQVVSMTGVFAYPFHGIGNGLAVALLVLGVQVVWKQWRHRDMILP
jgi:Gpi18-like mannosyltransferase